MSDTLKDRAREVAGAIATLVRSGDWGAYQQWPKEFTDLIAAALTRERVETRKQDVRAVCHWCDKGRELVLPELSGQNRRHELIGTALGEYGHCYASAIHDLIAKEQAK